MHRKDQVVADSRRATLSLDNPEKMAHDAVASGEPELNQDWQPPAVLDFPPAPAGFKLSWVRTRFKKDGDWDMSNLSSKIREGYRFYTKADLPEGYYAETIMDKRFNNGQEVVAKNDMVLMKIPLRMKRQRDAYYANIAEQQVQGIDAVLRNERAKTGTKLFVSEHRSSSALRSVPLGSGEED